MSDSDAPPEQPEQPPAAPAAPSTPSTSAPAASTAGVKLSTGQIVLLASAAVIFICSFFSWIHASVAHNVVICDHDRLVGYYSGNPYRQWLGTADQPLLGQVHLTQPHIVALVFRPGLGDQPQLAIGPYRAIAAFHSTSAAHGDVMLLYALPDSPIMLHGQPQFLATLPALPAPPPDH